MPRHRTRFRIFLILLLACATAYGAGLHVIDLRNRPADEILPVIRPLLQPGGSISGQGFRLFVRTSRRNLTDIRQAVATLDVPERMLRVSVRQSRGLNGFYSMGGVRRDANTHIIVSGREPPQLATRTESAGSYRIVRRTSQGLDYTTRFLTVLDGHRAFIQVGRSHPQVQPFVVLAAGQLDPGAEIEYRDVTTGFEILPRLHGDRVWIEVTPQFAFASNRGGQTVEFQLLRTTIDARIGQWVDLGGAVGTNSAITRTILGQTITTGSEKRRILIRIDK